MLSKQYRLPSLDIRKVLRRGKRLESRAVTLIYAPNALFVSRFAFIVSTKIDKRAVIRNQTRRTLSESVRLLLPTLRPGFDVLFLAKPDAVGKNVETLKPVIADLLKKAGL